MPTQPKPKRPVKAKPKAKAGKQGNMTPKPAKLEKATTADKKPSGRAVKHDWSIIRREYVKGDDNVTYLALSQREGAPHHATIEIRAAKEGWTDLRLDFRREVDAKLRMLDVDVKTEVRKRHGKMGQAMTNLGGQSLKIIAERLAAQQVSSRETLSEVSRRLKAGEDPDSPEIQMLMDRAADARKFIALDTMDIVRFIKYGTDLERKALGMEETTVNFRNISSPDDLLKLSTDELWKLAGMLPPDEEDDEDF